MFNCGGCGKTSLPRERPHVVPVKTRKKVYENGGIGWEIVEEKKICDVCNEYVHLKLDMFERMGNLGAKMVDVEKLFIRRELNNDSL